VRRHVGVDYAVANVCAARIHFGSCAFIPVMGQSVEHIRLFEDSFHADGYCAILIPVVL